MARQVEQTIAPPVLGPRGEPRSFRWRGRTFLVTAVLDCWRDTGAWWNQEAVKTFWRLQVREYGVFELWQDAGGGWAVYRIWD